MRFIVDECTGPMVARWLREQGHELFSVYDEARGMKDDSIIEKALTESWVLITNDKDFGEKVHKERRSHRGVVFSTPWRRTSSQQNRDAQAVA